HRVSHSCPTLSPLSSLTVTATTETYTLSLHDALPISSGAKPWTTASGRSSADPTWVNPLFRTAVTRPAPPTTSTLAPGSSPSARDRKSTRLNSSHVKISYAVFCLKKKKKHNQSESRIS